ncbi:MAG: hypothetical protein CVU56_07200, partial [Deltaproteobacteria bacterium HGW-Deltaproteobacteria-14]
MAAPVTFPTLKRLVPRVDPRASGARVSWIIAPAGYGKSALLAELATALRAARTAVAVASVAQCEGHLGLFLDGLARSLRAVLPHADVRPLLAGAGEAHQQSWLRDTIATVLGGEELVLLLDEAHLLAHGEPLTRIVAGLVGAPPPGVSLVLAARERPPFAEPSGAQVGRAELELTEEEVHEVLAARVAGVDEELSRRVWEKTRGWPAVVSLIAAAAAAPDGAQGLLERLNAGDGELIGEAVEHVLAGLRPEVRYFASVAALLEQFDLDFVVALFGSGGPGTPEERRRLIRLPAPALGDAVATLADKQLIVRIGDGWAFDPVCRTALADGFRRRDPEACREAHRRAAELLLARGEVGISEAFDHLVRAEAHERLLGLLEHHAERLLEVGDLRRLEGWLAVLLEHYGAPPFWVDYYLGCVLARRGDWDGARARLDDARAFVEATRGDLLEEGARGGVEGRSVAVAVHWQPRLAEAYADLLWRRGALVEARTWAQRGVDFLAQQARRGQLPAAAEAWANQALMRLEARGGRIAMDAGAADKAREALEQALERARGLGSAHWEGRILADLATNAARAAQVTACEAFAQAGLQALGEGWPELRARTLAAAALARLQVGDSAGAEARGA